MSMSNIHQMSTTYRANADPTTIVICGVKVQHGIKGVDREGDTSKLESNVDLYVAGKCPHLAQARILHKLCTWCGTVDGFRYRPKGN